ARGAFLRKYCALPLRPDVADSRPRRGSRSGGAVRAPAVRRLRPVQDRGRRGGADRSQALRPRRWGSMEHGYSELKRIIDSIGPCLVAFSGGVDSTFLLKVACDRLGGGVTAITAVSPSLPAAEREEAVTLARMMGATHLLVETHEMDDPDYLRNDGARCYYCKRELFGVLRRVAAESRGKPIVYGAIPDDLGDDRPGMRARAGCRPGPGRRWPAWRRASPACLPCPPRPCPWWNAPRRRCTPSDTARCASGTRGWARVSSSMRTVSAVRASPRTASS